MKKNKTLLYASLKKGYPIKAEMPIPMVIPLEMMTPSIYLSNMSILLSIYRLVSSVLSPIAYLFPLYSLRKNKVDQLINHGGSSVARI
jgi:hypothetical protein